MYTINIYVFFLFICSDQTSINNRTDTSIPEKLLPFLKSIIPQSFIIFRLLEFKDRNKYIQTQYKLLHWLSAPDQNNMIVDIFYYSLQKQFSTISNIILPQTQYDTISQLKFSVDDKQNIYTNQKEYLCSSEDIRQIKKKLSDTSTVVKNGLDVVAAILIITKKYKILLTILVQQLLIMIGPFKIDFSPQFNELKQWILDCLNIDQNKNYSPVLIFDLYLQIKQEMDRYINYVFLLQLQKQPEQQQQQDLSPQQQQDLSPQQQQDLLQQQQQDLSQQQQQDLSQQSETQEIDYYQIAHIIKISLNILRYFSYAFNLPIEFNHLSKKDFLTYLRVIIVEDLTSDHQITILDIMSSFYSKMRLGLNSGVQSINTESIKKIYQKSIDIQNILKKTQNAILLDSEIKKQITTFYKDMIREYSAKDILLCLLVIQKIEQPFKQLIDNENLYDRIEIFVKDVLVENKIKDNHLNTDINDAIDFMDKIPANTQLITQKDIIDVKQSIQIPEINLQLANVVIPEINLPLKQGNEDISIQEINLFEFFTNDLDNHFLHIIPDQWYQLYWSITCNFIIDHTLIINENIHDKIKMLMHNVFQYRNFPLSLLNKTDTQNWPLNLLKDKEPKIKLLSLPISLHLNKDVFDNIWEKSITLITEMQKSSKVLKENNNSEDILDCHSEFIDFQIEYNINQDNIDSFSQFFIALSSSVIDIVKKPINEKDLEQQTKDFNRIMYFLSIQVNISNNLKDNLSNTLKTIYTQLILCAEQIPKKRNIIAANKEISFSLVKQQCLGVFLINKIQSVRFSDNNINNNTILFDPIRKELIVRLTSAPKLDLGLHYIFRFHEIGFYSASILIGKKFNNLDHFAMIVESFNLPEKKQNMNNPEQKLLIQLDNHLAINLQAIIKTETNNLLQYIKKYNAIIVNVIIIMIIPIFLTLISYKYIFNSINTLTVPFYLLKNKK